MAERDEARCAVAASVAAFEPRWPREQASKRQFLAHLEVLDDPFRHDGQKVHVTGSALVFGRRGTVLHVHRKLGVWLQPGGHVDGGEMPADAALRETSEETGLPVRHPDGGPRLVHLDVHPAADAHVHLDLRYLLLSRDADPAPPPGESQQVRWWRIGEAMTVADHGLVEGLRRLEELAPGLEGELAS